ncbi:MAG: TlpA disulfide reductase family protein [Pseudoflavonifractor sp.]|nr:TlpA disulfide reductase family protein [Pseudoflavonifractor sp.]
MKRLMTFILALVLILSLAGCGKGNSPVVNNEQDSTSTQSTASDAPSVLNFANLGIQIKLKGAWLDLKDNIITLPAEGGSVQGVMVFFSNDEAQANAKTLTNNKADKADIDDAIWHNNKRLYAIAFANTKDVSVDEVAEQVGGPDKEATVTKLEEQGDITYYFCVYPQGGTDDLSSVSKEKYERLIKDLDTAKNNIELSEPESLPGSIASGNSVAFTTTDLDGNTVSSDIFKDHELTMINIWGSFCNPCIEELPTLQKLSDEMKDKDVAVVGILGDAMGPDGKPDEDNIDLAKSIIQEKKVTYLNLAMNSELDMALPIDVYPTTVLVDSNGNVVGAGIYGAQTETAYKQAIQDALDSLSK